VWIFKKRAKMTSLEVMSSFILKAEKPDVTDPTERYILAFSREIFSLSIKKPCEGSEPSQD